MINLKLTEQKSSLFTYYPPKNSYIGLISIPHSGEIIPSEFESFLSTNTAHLMQDLDYKVHELIDIELLQSSGIGVIKSHISRVAIDLNRSRDKTLLTWKNNSQGVKIVLKELNIDCLFVSRNPKKEDEISYPLCVNGKKRATATFPAGTSKADLEKAAVEHPAIQKWAAGKTIRKVIVVPNRMINIVIK